MASSIGSHVWVADSELAWVDGEVIEITDKKGKVQTSNGKLVEVDLSKIYPKDVELTDWGEDDMTRLSYLHEPGVLHNLSLRYGINQIYTYTGSILIAVNPFKKLPLYDEGIMESYKGMALGELPPHVFAVADAAYRRLIVDQKSQAILVSGESGAGKTETTKMLMRFLAQMGGRKSSGGRTVEQQVLESNPVLEAFGNAKTVRNNNSSRFGKFVELQFDKKGRISGAAVRTYLLERSRVCQISDPERNYHCFYMLCSAPKDVTDRYKLGDPTSFHYLNQSNCYELEGVSDAKEYLATRAAMTVVGIDHEEQEAIFRVVAGILHLGNVDFTKDADADSSKPKDDKAMLHLRTAAELFKCDAKGLEDSLCKRIMVTRDESIQKSLNPAAAAASRDALAKIVYSRLFDWLVNKINKSIGQDPDSETVIGVLDIYGFESFKSNSFEQFSINLTNEKLQQHFNQHVFKAEQEEYKKEEIQWSYIDFVDNQDVLDLIEKKPGGILALLDEACILPRSNHEKFAESLYKAFLKHQRFSKPKLSRTDFTIKHYAGDVTYQTELFLDKNKDYVIPEHQALLSASDCAFVSSLFTKESEQSSKSAKFVSLGSQFKIQLQTLVETLNKTEPHYIRCIKPNNLLKPGIFENNNVLQQLRCGGVMEAIRISCAGYPTKRSVDEFLDRYGFLCPEVYSENNDEKSASHSLLKKLGISDYQIGRTKVFLRAGQLAVLDARRTEVLGKSAKIIQSKFRLYVARKNYLAGRYSLISLQALWRGKLAQKLYSNMRRKAAATMIQKVLRRYQAQRHYTELRLSASVIQAFIRGTLARDEFRFRKETLCAITIQASWRRYIAWKTYEMVKRATIIAQCSWKGRVARKELKKLKMAARETGALQEAKNKLEKQVEELTYLLQWERTRMVEIEKEKAQETEHLQAALQEMEIQMKEASALLEKEREESKKAVEKEREESKKVIEKEREESRKTIEKEREESRKAIEKEREASQKAIEQAQEAAKMAMEQQSVKFKVFNQQEQETFKKATGLQHEALKKENETAMPILRKENEIAVPFFNENPVIGYTNNVEEVIKENKKLKNHVSSLEKRVSEAEKKYVESVKLCEERLQKFKAAEAEVQKLQISLHRLEEKVSNMKHDVKVAKESYPSNHTKSLSETSLDITAKRFLENGHADPNKPIDNINDTQCDTSKMNGPNEVVEKPPSYPKHNQEIIDALIHCVSQRIGFSNSRPVAAWSIYKSLAHWRLFEVEKTNVFDRIIEFIGIAIEGKSNDDLAYWLSNTSFLLFFLHHSFKGSDLAGMTPRKRRTATLFERMAQGFRSSSFISPEFGSGFGLARQVDPKSPALLFMQQISATVETIYRILRENIKHNLQQHLNSCILAPRTAKASMFKTVRLQANTSSLQGNGIHWRNIISCLSDFLESMQSNHVPSFFITTMVNEIFSFINVQLFNSLLLRRECCSFSNGEYVKAGLAELEIWCSEAKEYVGSAWDELKHIRQAVGFLVIHQKSKKSLDEIVHELCPALKIPQIYRISTMYKDDKYGTRSVAPHVLARLNALMAEDSNSDDAESLLLNDSCTYQFSGEEILKHIKMTDFSDIMPPQQLMENPNFQFLQPISA